MGESLDISADVGGISNSEELIRLAYAMVVEPHRHHVLAEVIDREISKQYDLVESDGSLPGAMFSDVAVHFQNALDLLNRQGRKTNTGSGAIRSVETDPSPSALLNPDMMIVHTNTAGKDIHNWTPDRRIDPNQLERNEFRLLQDSLNSLDDFDLDQAICALRISNPKTHSDHRYILTRSIDTNNRPLGRLTSANLTWLPDIAFQFQESFGLTAVELKLTQAIVTGQSLRDLAKERGRSLGTLRNQLKTLLAKLNLRSQTELTCLYSGYINLTRHDEQDRYSHTFRNRPWRRQHIFKTSDGSLLDYSVVGPKSGRPVLFFHSTIFSTAMSEAVQQEITRRNIRLIMPLRPGMGQTDLAPSSHGELEKFSHNCCELLDDLDIDQVQIVAKNTGIISGVITASLLGPRAIGLVGISPILPMIHKRYYSTMTWPQRSLYYTAKHAPQLLPHIIRSIVAKCDSGFDEEWILQYFKDSPYDLELMSQPEMKAVAREAFSLNYTAGTEGVVREFTHTGRNWAHYFTELSCKITLLTGEHNRQFTSNMLSHFSKAMNNVTVASLKKAAFFVQHQKPKEVYEIIEKQFENANQLLTQTTTT